MRLPWAPFPHFLQYLPEFATRIRATVRNHLGSQAGLAPAINPLQEELV
jgi:hypothetical protein